MYKSYLLKSLYFVVSYGEVTKIHPQRLKVVVEWVSIKNKNKVIWKITGFKTDTHQGKDGTLLVLICKKEVNKKKNIQ